MLTLFPGRKNIEHFENLAKVQAKNDQENISDKLSGVDQGTSYNSNNLVNQEVIETVVVIEYIQTKYVSMKIIRNWKQKLMNQG